MFDTHYATEVRETSGLVPVVGGLGAGKSVLLGQLTYEAVRRGIPSVVLDPSGPLARLTLASRVASARRALGPDDGGQRHPEPVRRRRPAAKIDLPGRRGLRRGSGPGGAGPQAAGHGRREDVVACLGHGDAQHCAGGLRCHSKQQVAIPTASLWDVVEHLERRWTNRHGRVVANYLRDMSELPLSRLFFPQQPARSRPPQRPLTVLTMPGLVLPPRSVPRDQWSTSEQLAVPLLHLASWYAARAVYGREMESRKLVALDETHFLGEWSAGRALFTRLGRDSRKWNTCVLAASQNPADVLGMDVANFMSAAFVGRIEDEESAAGGAADAAGAHRRRVRARPGEPLRRPRDGGVPGVRDARRRRQRRQDPGGPVGQPGPARGAEHDGRPPHVASRSEGRVA